jgi:hypothetical protein
LTNLNILKNLILEPAILGVAAFETKMAPRKCQNKKLSTFLIVYQRWLIQRRNRRRRWNWFLLLIKKRRKWPGNPGSEVADVSKKTLVGGKTSGEVTRKPDLNKRFGSPETRLSSLYPILNARLLLNDPYLPNVAWLYVFID